MPQLTIDLSEEAYALLRERAQDERLVPESEAVLLLEKALLLTPSMDASLRGTLRHLVTTIKGFVSTLLVDEDGTMFTVSDRREFYEIIDKACNGISESFTTRRRGNGRVFTFVARPTQLWDVIEAVRDEAAKSPYRLPTHKFVLEAGDNLPKTLLTDAETLKETLWTFLEQALRYTPAGGEVRIVIRNQGDSALFFSITDHGHALTPEFVATFAQHLNAPLLNTDYIGGPIYHKQRLFVQWHRGTFSIDSNAPNSGTTVSFTLRLFDEMLGTLDEDERYLDTLHTLRQACLRLLSETEALGNMYPAFDDEARQALAAVVQTECDALTALAQSLSRSDISAAGA